MTRRHDGPVPSAIIVAGSDGGRRQVPPQDRVRHPNAALWCAGLGRITKSSHRLEIICRPHYDQHITNVVHARSARWIRCLPSLPGETQGIPVSRPHDDRAEEEARAFVTASSASHLRTAPARTAADPSLVISVSLNDGASLLGAERRLSPARFLSCSGTDRRHASSDRIAVSGAVRLSDVAGLLANSLKINGRELG